MAEDSLASVRSRFALRFAEARKSGPRLSPLELDERMSAIRKLAGGRFPARSSPTLASVQQLLLPTD